MTLIERSEQYLLNQGEPAYWAAKNAPLLAQVIDDNIAGHVANGYTEKKATKHVFGYMLAGPLQNDEPWASPRGRNLAKRQRIASLVALRDRVRGEMKPRPWHEKRVQAFRRKKSYANQMIWLGKKPAGFMSWLTGSDFATQEAAR
jgi:hypothetical protein